MRLDTGVAPPLKDLTPVLAAIVESFVFSMKLSEAQKMLPIAANLVEFTCQPNKFTVIPRALRNLILPFFPFR